MANYIDADNVQLKGISVFDQNLEILVQLSDVRKALQMTPTADVQEVRHGYWYWYEEPHSFYDDSFDCGWKCSCCNNHPDHDNYVADDYENKLDLKYCNNCGAKMDGKE